MTIHTGHPFADPDPARDPLRRFRGRLTAPVTLWATGRGSDRAGLTVSSMLTVPGEPGRIIGLIDPDSDLGEELTVGVAVAVGVLTWGERDLAEAFAFTAPAPGGPFAQAEFTETDWGPVPSACETWLGARVESVREIGWSAEVAAVVEQVNIGPDDMAEPLLHRRGRWVRPHPAE